MARKTKIVTIDGDPSTNRDAGKNFLITEMPASKAEKWAARCLLALVNAGFEIDDNDRQLGMAAMAARGVRSLGSIAWHDAEPLLDEMMGCVHYLPSLDAPDVHTPLVEHDIEEVSTRIFLRDKVFELHVGFSPAARMSMSQSLAAQGQSNSETTQI
jgi:hypothetical protein